MKINKVKTVASLIFLIPELHIHPYYTNTSEGLKHFFIFIFFTEILMYSVFFTSSCEVQQHTVK